LFFKRIAVKEVKRISLLADYFALGLILAHIIDGVYMTYFTEFDLQEGVKWGIGLVTFHPHIVQDSWIFAVHCLTGFGLFLYFPFSKLFKQDAGRTDSRQCIPDCLPWSSLHYGRSR